MAQLLFTLSQALLLEQRLQDGAATLPRCGDALTSSLLLLKCVYHGKLGRACVRQGELGWACLRRRIGWSIAGLEGWASRRDADLDRAAVGLLLAERGLRAVFLMAWPWLGHYGVVLLASAAVVGKKLVDLLPREGRRVDLLKLHVWVTEHLAPDKLCHLLLLLGR